MGFRWDDHSFNSVLVTFIQRQNLVELRLNLLHFTPPALAVLVSSAPALTFNYVELDLGRHMDGQGGTMAANSGPEQLLFHVDPTTILNALSRPRPVSWMRNIRKLGLPVIEGYELTITAAAGSLEHIRFERSRAFPGLIYLSLLT